MNNIAIITDKDEKITYDDLKMYIETFSSKMIFKSTILIIASNTIGCMVGYVSCLKSGNVPLMISRDMNFESIQEYIEKYKFNFLWVPDMWIKENVAEYKIIYREFGYCLIENNIEQPELHKDLALLLTTSGTTGSNKLVRISRDNIEANTNDIINYLSIDDRDRAITLLPMNYTYGLSVINTHLKSRGTILLTELRPFQSQFWDFFNKYGGTSIAAVPYTYEMLLKLGFKEWKLDTLRTMTVAGGKIGITEEQYFIEYAKINRKKFIIMYGQTEATARISYRPWNMAEEKSGSIGIPIPNGRMWLEDTNGNVVSKPYTQGEIIYQGKNVTMGYAYELSDLSKGDERKGILNTGDLGYIDEDNYFYIIGRGDRTVKINGHRIDLKDMEKKIEADYPEYKVVCEIEKCLDTGLHKRIKIILENRDKSIHCVQTSENTKKIIDMISWKMNISSQMIYIEIQQ